MRLFLFALLLLVACKPPQGKGGSRLPAPDSADARPDGLRFAYRTRTARPLVDTGALAGFARGDFEVLATLHNDRSTPVHFQTWSCEGIFNDLRYDSTAISNCAQAACNASWPIIISIPAHDSMNFTVPLCATDAHAPRHFDFRMNIVTGPWSDSALRRYQQLPPTTPIVLSGKSLD